MPSRSPQAPQRKAGTATPTRCRCGKPACGQYPHRPHILHDRDHAPPRANVLRRERADDLSQQACQQGALSRLRAMPPTRARRAGLDESPDPDAHPQQARRSARQGSRRDTDLPARSASGPYHRWRRSARATARPFRRGPSTCRRGSAGRQSTSPGYRRDSRGAECMRDSWCPST